MLAPSVLLTACYVSAAIQLGPWCPGTAAALANAYSLHTSTSRRITYGRSTLLALRRTTEWRSCRSPYLDATASHDLLHYRGCRAGHNKQRPISIVASSPSHRCADRFNYPVRHSQLFSVKGSSFTANPHTQLRYPAVGRPPSSLVHIKRVALPPSRPSAHLQPQLPLTDVLTPSLYVLNASSLAKPHALQQLEADLKGYDADVAVISETHFKKKHADSAVSLTDYTLARKDREGRRGGGVAVYAPKNLTVSVINFKDDMPNYELLWINITGCNYGSIVHISSP